jgi:hypothetical protein
MWGPDLLQKPSEIHYSCPFFFPRNKKAEAWTIEVNREDASIQEGNRPQGQETYPAHDMEFFLKNFPLAFAANKITGGFR